MKAGPGDAVSWRIICTGEWAKGKYNRLVGGSSNLPPKRMGGGGRPSRFLQLAVRRNYVHWEALAQ